MALALPYLVLLFCNNFLACCNLVPLQRLDYYLSRGNPSYNERSQATCKYRKDRELDHHVTSHHSQLMHFVQSVRNICDIMFAAIFCQNGQAT
jgi:hypothetical protein